MESATFGQKLLAQRFAADELTFLLTYEEFAYAAPRVATQEDGEHLVRIGQTLLKRAWQRASKEWPRRSE